MKKLILLLLMAIGVINPAIDTTGTTKYVDGNRLSTTSTNHFTARTYADGNGFWFYDSLWTGNYIVPNDTTFSGSDTTVILDTVYARTSFIIPLKFDYDWLQIAIYDSGTTYDDTLKIERGFIRPYRTGNAWVATDTTWHGVSFNDSTWTTVSTDVPVDDNSVHVYTIYDALMGLLKVTITNVQTVANRVTYIWGSAKKRNK